MAVAPVRSIGSERHPAPRKLDAPSFGLSSIPGVRGSVPAYLVHSLSSFLRRSILRACAKSSTDPCPFGFEAIGRQLSLGAIFLRLFHRRPRAFPQPTSSMCVADQRRTASASLPAFSVRAPPRPVSVRRIPPPPSLLKRTCLCCPFILLGGGCFVPFYDVDVSPPSHRTFFGRLPWLAVCPPNARPAPLRPG